MKKLLFTITLCCSISIGFSQDDIFGGIKFKQVFRFSEDEEVKTFYLYFNTLKSLYIEQVDQEIKDDMQITPDEEDGILMSVKIDMRDNLPLIIQTNRTTKKILIHNSLYEKGEFVPVIVKDVAGLCSWEVPGETKKIGSFDCEKALTTFRGRYYTAWFTRHIPIGFGPWKLNGLPGMILEAYDKTGEVYFVAESVIIPYEGDLKSMPETDTVNARFMTLREFVESSDKIVDETLSMIMTKLPRGSDFQIDEVTTNTIELDYEFEDE